MKFTSTVIACSGKSEKWTLRRYHNKWYAAFLPRRAHQSKSEAAWIWRHSQKTTARHLWLERKVRCETVGATSQVMTFKQNFFGNINTDLMFNIMTYTFELCWSLWVAPKISICVSDMMRFLGLCAAVVSSFVAKKTSTQTVLLLDEC